MRQFPILPAIVSSAALLLAACGGGGGADGTPASTAPTAAVQQSADPAASPTPVAAAEAPASSAPQCGPNGGGLMFECDPRWPFPGVAPVDGATQDQVDGYNAMCSTWRCMKYRCDDGRVVSWQYQLQMCAMPPDSTQAMSVAPAPQPVPAASN
jgi:hypothetical protein